MDSRHTTVVCQEIFRVKGSVSILSLALQIIIYVALGISQAMRLGIPHRILEILPATWMEPFFMVGHASVNFLIAALGLVVLFVECLYVE